MNSIDRNIAVTDQQLEAAFDAIDCPVHIASEATPYLNEPEAFVVSSNAISDFEDSAARRWAECRRIERTTAVGFPAAVFHGVQVERGQPRVDLYVVEVAPNKTISYKS